MRRFLFVMGLIFVGLLGSGIAALGYVGVLASQSAEDNKKAAVDLVKDVSDTWSVDRVANVFTPAALAQATSRQGRTAMAVMSRLGSLREVRNVRQTGYNIDFVTGTTVTVTFDGQFEFGKGAVTVTLRYMNDKPKIVELDLKQIRLRVVKQRRVAV